MARVAEARSRRAVVAAATRAPCDGCGGSESVRGRLDKTVDWTIEIERLASNFSRRRVVVVLGGTVALKLAGAIFRTPHPLKRPR